MDVLIVRPLGGLANRIRVIKAAQSFASGHGARLILIWDKDNVLNARFEECFDTMPGVKIINVSYSGYGVFREIQRKIIHRLYLLSIQLTTQTQVFDREAKKHLPLDADANQRNSFFDKLAVQFKRVYIQTCYDFYPHQDDFFMPFREDLLEKFSIPKNWEDVIGIHVRRGDNSMSKQYSPLEMFIIKMNELIYINPAIKFYVSTDSDEVYEKLKTLFGDSMYTTAIVRTRDTLAGIQSALLDLYCLSKCKKIVGSYDSSFSEVAAKMGGIPLEVIFLKKQMD